MKNLLIISLFFLLSFTLKAQVKILFDATKAETAGSADWVIDADVHNLGYSTGPPVAGSGNESNPQRYPTPDQSTVTTSTVETYWEGALSAWGIDCVKKGYYVETLPYNGAITYGSGSNVQDLSNYKVFVVCEPNIVFTTAEKTAIMNFIQNGGGLMMISDHNGSDRNNDGWDSPAIWNDLMTNNGIQSNPFGIAFDLVDISQTTTNIPSLPGDPLLHGVMGDVTSAMWSDGTTMTLSPTSNSTIKGIIYKTGSAFGNTNAMVAYSSYGSGKVVGVGDSSPCDDGTGDPNDVLYNGWTGDASGNHERLLMNATIWLASSSGTLPTATTTAATSVTMTSATLNGTVNPNGVATTYHFDWGTTVSYGTSTTATSAGSGSSVVSESAGISGLTAGTTYHYRIVAVSSSGTTNGSDLTLTTTSPTLSVTPSNQAVAATSGSTQFTVTSNSSWTASSNQSWCTVTTSGSGNGTITANYAANLTVASRVANVTVTVTGLTPIVVTVTQAAGAPTLSVTPSNQAVAATSGSTSFSVTSNTSWTASSDQSWCTVTTSGSGNGTITANYTANLTIVSRIANVTITVTGLTPIVVTVTQAAGAPTLSVTPSNQAVTATAGTTTFSVTSNTGWTVSSDQSWCIVTPSGSGSGSITATYSDNLSVTSRIALVTVTVTGLTSVVVTVTQAGAAPTLTVTPSNQDVSDFAGSTSFAVTSNTNWTVTSDQTWCVPTSSGSGNGTITASYAQNPSYSTRVANITVTVTGLAPTVVTVSQAVSSLAPEPTHFPTNFSAYNIIVQWTDATGDVVPNGYLIRMSSVGFSSIVNPVDGVPVPNSNTDKNVASGIQQAWFGNLLPNTTYYFKIFSYTGSGTGIDYKIDGDTPQLQQTTKP